MHNLADSALRPFEADVRTAHENFIARCVENVLVGLYPVDKSSSSEFFSDLVEIKQRHMIPLSFRSAKLAGMVIDELQSKVEDVRMDLLLETNLDGVYEYIKETSTIETKFTSRKIGEVFDDASSMKTENGKPYTVKDIARELQARGLAMSRYRATLIARTGTIWSLNEGSMLKYKSAGIQFGEWFVTDDDRLCEFCLSMSGKRVRMGTNFFNSGDNLEVPEAGTLSFPFVIQHPPLHPQCRCVLVPIVTF